MRSLLFVVSLLAAASMPLAASALDAKFLIKRKGKVIGEHVVTVSELGEATLVETRIDMEVKFGPFPVFQYQHRSNEEWRGGDLVSLQSETDYDGDELFVKARREGDRLYIEGSDYTGYAPATAKPSSYWNKDLVRAEQMINTQTGELMDISVTPQGVTPTPDGVPAEHYRLVGSLPLDLWYDGERWIGSTFEVDGEFLTYEYVGDEASFAQATNGNGAAGN